MAARTAPDTAIKILVIDDEPFIQAITVHQLQDLGYQQIETASDGADALGVMQNATLPFALVICDLNMPVMDGFDFMYAAQAINYQGALIVLSSEEPQQLTAAMELGLTLGLRILGALRKPLEREVLQEMLIRAKTSPDQ
jgi:CheY-like chemotaxis protein